MHPVSRLATLARAHLTADEADRWISQVTATGLILSPDRKAVERAGQLGGEPDLPDDVGWPVWEGHGPLSFIAALDCAVMADRFGGHPWPATGTLLFFYFDGQADDHQAWVTPTDPASLAGSRVLYVPADASTSRRTAPAPLKAYPSIRLVAQPAAGAPDRIDDGVTDRDDPSGSAHPGFDALESAIAREYRPQHQVGGDPYTIQQEVRDEAAWFALGRADEDDDEDEDDEDDDDGFEYFEDPELDREADRWELLLQVASEPDRDMVWGDGGALYWLIKPEDLAGLRLECAFFTWQCH